MRSFFACDGAGGRPAWIGSISEQPAPCSASAVLCPYLRAGDKLTTRAFALIAASALSYFCAVLTVLNADTWFSVGSGPVPFLLGSLVGVTIVLVSARFLIPLRVTAAFWLLGLGASLIGGVAMYAGFEVFGNTTTSTVVGFCVRHVMACIAIDRGRAATDAEDGLLATLVRTRGRFSIVPGWMKLSHSTVLLTGALASASLAGAAAFSRRR